MRFQGSAPPVSLDDYEASLHQLLQPLIDMGSRVVVCGVGPVDGRLFPGADATFPLYRQRAFRTAEALKADFVDVNAALCGASTRLAELLLLDRLHPNGRGHAVIAERIVHVLAPKLEAR
jgi:lysophospholipase L1-like esterase